MWAKREDFRLQRAATVAPLLTPPTFAGPKQASALPCARGSHRSAEASRASSAPIAAQPLLCDELWLHILQFSRPNPLEVAYLRQTNRQLARVAADDSLWYGLQGDEEVLAGSRRLGTPRARNGLCAAANRRLNKLSPRAQTHFVALCRHQQSYRVLLQEKPRRWDLGPHLGFDTMVVATRYGLLKWHDRYRIGWDGMLQRVNFQHPPLAILEFAVKQEHGPTYISLPQQLQSIPRLATAALAAAPKNVAVLPQALYGQPQVLSALFAHKPVWQGLRQVVEHAPQLLQQPAFTLALRKGCADALRSHCPGEKPSAPLTLYLWQELPGHLTADPLVVEQFQVWRAAHR